MIYSDIDINLERHPVTNDILKKIDANDVRQSLKLLVKTQYYDRLWNPQVGSRLQELLFKQNDSYERYIFKTELQKLIDSFEPRVNVESITVEQNKINLSQVDVTIVYNILKLNKQDTYVYQLTRLR